MPSPEHGGASPDPERPPQPEQGPVPYRRAVRFAGERPAGLTYTAAEAAIFARPDSDVSVFRFLLDRTWHVAALGLPPPPDLEETLTQILAAGEPTDLPPDIWQALTERRAQAIRQGPWVERHYRPDQPR